VVDLVNGVQADPTRHDLIAKNARIGYAGDLITGTSRPKRCSVRITAEASALPIAHGDATWKLTCFTLSGIAVSALLSSGRPDNDGDFQSGSFRNRT
jgi:hypothetical protein